MCIRDRYARPQLLVKAGPIILIAIGLSIGFKAGIWNIGAEGQYILGAIFGATVALSVYPQESVLIFPAMILAGALGGFIWALIPALLKVYFKTNEILVSLMLVYVAENILASVSQGLLRNPGFRKRPWLTEARMFSATYTSCLLYTSPSPRDRTRSRMPSSA